MKRIRTSHLIVAVVALLMLAVAGTSYGSNMAFKINASIVGSPACGINNICDNWISLPFNNPAMVPKPTTVCPSAAPACIRAICDTNGDGAVGAADTMQFVSQQSATNIDTLITHSCTGLVGINNPAYQPTRAVRVRPKTGLGTVQVVFVGSDVPGTQITVRQTGTVGGCSICDNWIDLVYHTTHTNLRSACDTNNNGIGGGTTVDSTDVFQFVSQQSASAVDTLVTHSCTGLAGINNPTIQIGRGLRARLKSGVVGDQLISEPHF